MSDHSSDPPKMFISYAHKDQHWLDEVLTVLKPLVRNGDEVIWTDHDIKPSDKWNQKIEDAMHATDIALLLVSRHFLASDYIMDNELPYLVEAAETRGVKILWVLLSACLFDETPLVDFQAATNPGKPLDKLNDGETSDVLNKIAKEVRRVASEFREERIAYPNQAEGTDQPDEDFDHQVLFDTREDGDRVGSTFVPSRVSHLKQLIELNDNCQRIEFHSVPSESGQIEYIVVTEAQGPFTTTYPIGVFDRDITMDLFDHFLAQVDAPFRKADPAVRTRIISDHPIDPQIAARARKHGIWAQTYLEFSGLIDFSNFIANQTKRLKNDPIYPPALFIPQRFTGEIGQYSTWEGDDALEHVFDCLRSPESARFVLVLGEFGTGKTFLLHEVARRMPNAIPHLTPILIEMRALEKGRTLDELLAQHMMQVGEHGYDRRKFNHMLKEGRIALLFDGFDELALRVTYQRASEHFDTLLSAVDGKAKVVVTSRTQHFISTSQATMALYDKVEQVGHANARYMALQPFNEDRMQQFLSTFYRLKLAEERECELTDLTLQNDAQRQADDRLCLIHDVKDLLGLSANPRMLSFIADLETEQLEQAKDPSGKITSAELYRVLLDRWMKHEVERRSPGKAPLPTFDKEHLIKAVTSLALRLWRNTQREISLEELAGDVGATIKKLDTFQMNSDEAAHVVGSGSVLVRSDDEKFAFIHQSIMEWLVANEAARQILNGEPTDVLTHRAMSELMADFFCGLVGTDRAREWMEQQEHAEAESAADAGKKNAAMVRKRLQVSFAVNFDEDDWPRPDMSGQDLSGQDLSGQDLRGADLRGANLTQTLLIGSKLDGADLTDAILHRAKLDGASLRSACLHGADLSHADLMDVDLNDAAIDEATTWHRARIANKTDQKPNLHSEFTATPASGGGVVTPDISIHPCFQSRSLICRSVAYSPDGSFVASGHDDGTIRLWDVITGDQLASFVGHTNEIRSVAFNPDGTRLASGSEDNTVRLWDVNNAQQIALFKGHQDSVESVAFNPDGTLLASASWDGTLRIWPVPTEPMTDPVECLVTLIPLPDGWAAVLPSGRYKLEGNPAGRFWHLANLIRFDPGELAPYLDNAKPLPMDEIVIPHATKPHIS